MKSLPNEIFSEIFPLLHQKDKVECMTVCRLWQELISTGCLFQTLCVYTLDGLKKTITKMKEDPKQASRVRRLIIDFLCEDTFDLNPLIPLFPHLESLLLVAPEGDQDINKDIIYPWHKYIKHITECAGTTVTYQLLSNTVCPNLTILSIAEEYKDIIPILGNAPALEHLDITPGDIHFTELNLIHSKLPRLKSLHISIFTLDGSDYSPYIEPAISMTECTYMNVTMPSYNDETEINLINFISLKYPNLKKLQYRYNAMEPERETNYFDRINKRGWIPLFKRLGPTLKDVRICGGNEPPGLCKMLDDGNCKLERFRFGSIYPSQVPELSGSKQAQYIQLLKLDDSTVIKFDWLKHFVNLKQLFISWEYRGDDITNPINLNEILQNCPKLKSLHFQFGVLNVDNSDTAVFPLQELTLRSIKFPKTFDQFLAKNTPHLKKLKLSCCELEEETFDLSPLDLLMLEIEDRLSYDGRGTVVKTHKGNEEQWYPMKDICRNYLTFYREGTANDPTIIPRVQPLTMDRDFDDAPFFTLICNSLYAFNYAED